MTIVDHQFKSMYMTRIKRLCNGAHRVPKGSVYATFLQKRKKISPDKLTWNFHFHGQPMTNHKLT